MIRFDPKRETVFNPPDLKLQDNPTKCLFIYDDEIWEDHILPNKELKTFPVKNVYGRVFDTYRYIKIGEEKILVVSPDMGAPASVCIMELLIASGIKRIVSFGTCGRLDKNIAKNTIILPTSAYREEGTSYHYLPDQDEIDVDEDALSVVERVLKEDNFTIRKGKIWTTDAVYRETIDKVKLMEERGCIGVDMELSALIALAEYRNIKFASFLIGDDAVDGDVAEPLERRNGDIFSTAVRILQKI